ncbi:hypothetical protein FHU38_002495 [Saccharomonospora amisosensis]|uniref:Uncharacterized protein n=1 Tax=Saccharomonospora amisosensis TaxID=1128677 RepID=A0A7X5UQ71_9PSEU|nr:DUF6114 domain-containing protein [Saccharomonospora amisosensis]NIJ12151.1 hypothetical protein [Saccharomonospora amisosensis]
MVAASGNADPARGEASGEAEEAADVAGGKSRRKTFRRWRRSRPFWGGLLLVVAGIELLSLPLLDVFMKGAVGLVMHMGVGGISGVVIGAMLTACGVLLWFDPAHKTFYAVIGVLGGIVSFPATNFGGFMLGMLLGIIGGSLAFGWTERSSAPSGDSEHRTAGGTKAGEDTSADDAAGAGRASGSGSDTTAENTGNALGFLRRRGVRLGKGRALLVWGMAATVVGPLLVAGSAEASQATQQRSADECELIVFCSPSTPAPEDPDSSGVVPTPSVPGLPSVDVPLPPVNDLPEVPHDKNKDTEQEDNKRASGTAGIQAYTAPVVLKSGSVHVTGFAYEGVADVPLAGGGSVRMMKFTATTFRAYDGMRGDISQNGGTTVMTSPSFNLSGDIVLFATKFSGKLMGVPVTLTPGNAESQLMQALKSLTPKMPITMTDVSANQPIMVARSAHGNIAISAG